MLVENQRRRGSEEEKQHNQLETCDPGSRWSCVDVGVGFGVIFPQGTYKNDAKILKLSHIRDTRIQCGQKKNIMTDCEGDCCYLNHQFPFSNNVPLCETQCRQTQLKKFRQSHESSHLSNCCQTLAQHISRKMPKADHWRKWTPFHYFCFNKSRTNPSQKFQCQAINNCTEDAQTKMRFWWISRQEQPNSNSDWADPAPMLQSQCTVE